MLFRSKRTGVIIVVVILTLAVFIAVARPKRSSYTEVTSTTGDITTYFSFPGTIAANNSQIVYADSALQVMEVHVEEGQLVTKDEVLMTMVGGAEITAPMDGTAAQLFAVRDEQKMPGAQLIRIVDYTRLVLDVKVDEYDLPAMAVGKEALITVHALSREVTGTVVEIAREGVHLNGVTSFKTTLTLQNDSELRVGMTAEAKVLNQGVRGVALLPMSAVQFRTDNSSYVYIGDGKRLPVEKEVELGVHDGTQVEIKSGLASGETVLVPSADTGGGFFGNRMNDRDNDNG